MSPPWSIPDYAVIATILAGVGVAVYFAHGLYAHAF
jgi:hypothetical protein